MGLMNNGVVYALWDYSAEFSDELSFREGEPVTVLRRDGQEELDWWWASLYGQEGYVPKNYFGVSLLRGPEGSPRRGVVAGGGCRRALGAKQWAVPDCPAAEAPAVGPPALPCWPSTHFAATSLSLRPFPLSAVPQGETAAEEDVKVRWWLESLLQPVGGEERESTSGKGLHVGLTSVGVEGARLFPCFWPAALSFQKSRNGGEGWHSVLPVLPPHHLAVFLLLYESPPPTSRIVFVLVG